MNGKLQKVINLALDIPAHKLDLMVWNRELLTGCYRYLAHYGFSLNPELAEMFIRALEIKLVGHEEVEYEWTEQQWENLEYIKTL